MDETASAILSRQRDYFATGATFPYAHRLQALQSLRQAILRREADILEALREDLGKSPAEGYMTEVGMVLEELSFTIKHLKGWMRPQRVRTPLTHFPASSRIFPEPVGTVLILSPWNYPFQLTVAPLIGAIAAGCTAVVKPSAYAPATAALIQELLDGCFACGYVRTVTGGRQENADLLRLPFDYIFFTGGVTVGKLVLEAAARHCIPVTLELGGKSPCIVDRTANIPLAAKRICFGKFLNAGQTCVAPDYVLAEESIREELMAAIKACIRDFYGAEPLACRDYPHIVNRRHFDRLTGLLEGQPVYCGGGADPSSLRISPTLLDRPSPDAPVMQEEIFGPILPVLSFQELSEAEAFVRARPKPLALYLFSEDKAIQTHVTQRLSFGGGCINDTVLHLATPYMGFGGVGASGMGQYHGKRSFDTFTHYKSVLCQSGRIDLPVRYPPYTVEKDRLIRRLLK